MTRTEVNALAEIARTQLASVYHAAETVNEHARNMQQVLLGLARVEVAGGSDLRTLTLTDYVALSARLERIVVLTGTVTDEQARTAGAL